MKVSQMLCFTLDFNAFLNSQLLHSQLKIPSKYPPFFPLSQCCDLGYHASLNRALRTYLSAEFNVETSKHSGLETIENAAENLEANADKQRLMETYNNVFCPPMRFDFQSHMGDMVSRCDYYCLWHDSGEMK